MLHLLSTVILGEKHALIYLMYIQNCYTGEMKQKHITVERKCKLLITELSGMQHVYPLTSLTGCFCGDVDLVYSL